MHRHKIVPTILLILSLINFLLAAPVVLQEPRQECVDTAYVPEDVIPMSRSEKQSDEIENPWDKYSDEPWQKRGSSGSSLAQEVGEPPADDSGELATDSPPSPSPQAGTSTNYDASDEGGPGSIKSHPPPSNGPELDLVAPNEGTGTASGLSIMSHPPSNRPETEMVSTSPPRWNLWDPEDWSESSSEAEENFMNKIKGFFDNLVYKCKFCLPGKL
jgi:hypothetical protein